MKNVNKFKVRSRTATWSFVFASSFWLSVFLLIGPGSLNGAVLTISGHLNVSDIINKTNRLISQEQFRVSIDLSTNAWRIDDISEPPKSAFTFKDYILDRENAAPSIPLPVFSASSYTDNGYPIDLDQDQRTIWLAYCASTFLRQHDGKPVILPDQDARSTVTIYGCRARNEWRSQSDLCPRKIDFQFSNDSMTNFSQYLSYQVPGESLDVRQNQLTWYLSWVKNGMLRATFEVSVWTNANNVGIPLAWSISYFQEGTLYRKFFGTSESVLHEDSVELPIPKVIRLRDLRVFSLGKLNSVSYNVTNAAIPPLDNTNLARQILKLSRIQYRQMPDDVQKQRTAIAIVLILLLIAPLAVAVTRFLKRRVQSS